MSLLEDTEFDVQEFFGIAAEVADQQAQIAGKSRHVVVQSGIAENFPERTLIGVHLPGRIADVRRSITQIREERIVCDELAERAFALIHATEE